MKESKHELKQPSPTLRVFATVLFSCLLLALWSCASQKPRPDRSSSSSHSGSSLGTPVGTATNPTLAQDNYGPQPPERVYGPAPVETRPITLVLGPGLARGFAIAGVIHTLSEQKIPIGAIVATEMGAVIGALYAMDGNLNQFDWRVLQLKDDFFSAPGKLGAFFKWKSDAKKLSDYTAQVFASKDLSQFKIPFLVGVERIRSSQVWLAERGPAGALIRGAALSSRAYAPTPVKIGAEAESEEIVSVGERRPFLVEEARRFGGPVVVVDVCSGSGGTATGARSGEAGAQEQDLVAPLQAACRGAQAEVESADLVIRPDLRDFSFLDYSKRSQLSYEGKRAALQKLMELRSWAGLPQSGDSVGDANTTE